MEYLRAISFIRAAAGTYPSQTGRRYSESRQDQRLDDDEEEEEVGSEVGGWGVEGSGAGRERQRANLFRRLTSSFRADSVTRRARGARAAAGTRRAAAQAGRAAPSRGGRDFFSGPRFLFLEEQRLGGGGAGSFAETSHTPRCRRCAARSSACSWAPPRDHLGTSRVL